MYSTQPPFNIFSQPPYNITSDSSNLHNFQPISHPNAHIGTFHPQNVFQHHHEEPQHVQIHQMCEIPHTPLCDIESLCDVSVTDPRPPSHYENVKVSNYSDPNYSHCSPETYMVNMSSVEGQEVSGTLCESNAEDVPRRRNSNEVEEEGEGDEGKKEREHKKRSKNWSRSEILKLITVRKELEPKFAKGGKKLEHWDEVSECLQDYHVFRDTQQCRDKWEKLVSGYKAVMDGLRDREDHPFFDDLHPLLCSKAFKKDKEVRRLDKGQSPPLMTEGCKDSEGDVNEEKECDDIEDEEFDFDLASCRGTKKRRLKHVFASDLCVVKELVDTVIEKQQVFFKELLETVERREQLREEVRQQREEKWRAEERAEREVFNKFMIALTQKLVGDGVGSYTASLVPLNGQSFGNGNHGNSAHKKRSKIWKREEVLQLIRLRGEMDSGLSECIGEERFWNEIAETLVGLGIKGDARQCREKWDELIIGYRDVLSTKKEASTCPFFSELAATLRRQEACLQ